MTVLIVDDESYMTEYLKELVDWSDYGFDTVLTAGGGSLAKDLIREHEPQLLITDIKMPRVSGLDLAEFVSEQCLDTKVVIVSGYSEFEYAKQAMRFGVSEYLVKPVLQENVTETLGRIFGKKVAKGTESEKPYATGNQEEIIGRAQLYICENFDRDLSLDLLAEVVHLNPSYLSRLFKEITGQNLSAYITDVRMEKAAQLLDQTDLRVHEVMEAVGYQKSQHFARLFREKYGVTPKEYRKNGGKG